MSLFGNLFGRKKRGSVEEDPATEKPAEESEQEAEPLVDRTGNDDDRNMNLAVDKHNLWVALRLLFILLTLSVCFNGYYMMSSKFIPVIVAIDDIGRKVIVGPVTKSRPIDVARVTYREVQDFIEFARWVSADPIYQRKLLRYTESRVKSGSPAAKVIEAFHVSRPPYETAEKLGTYSVEIKSALKQSDRTYSVEWIETFRNLNGEAQSTERWKVLLTIDWDPSDEEDTINANPFGFYISDISWSRMR